MGPGHWNINLISNFLQRHNACKVWSAKSKGLSCERLQFSPWEQILSLVILWVPAYMCGKCGNASRLQNKKKVWELFYMCKIPLSHCQSQKWLGGRKVSKMRKKSSTRERETQCRKCQQSWLKFEPENTGCWRKSSNGVLVFSAAWSSPISALNNPWFYFVCSSSSENKALCYKFTSLNLLQVLEPSNGTSKSGIAHLFHHELFCIARVQRRCKSYITWKSIYFTAWFILLLYLYGNFVYCIISWF